MGEGTRDQTWPGTGPTTPGRSSGRCCASGREIRPSAEAEMRHTSRRTCGIARWKGAEKTVRASFRSVVGVVALPVSYIHSRRPRCAGRVKEGPSSCEVFYWLKCRGRPARGSNRGFLTVRGGALVAVYAIVRGVCVSLPCW